MEDFDKVTSDHEQIKQWAGRHDAKPALIETEGLPAEKVGLRFDFPGNKDEALLTESRQSEDVAWSSFFVEFENQQLALMYKDDFTDATQSYKFVPRDSIVG